MIDAHQHFWVYNPQDYAWIDDRMAAIRGDFLPARLELATKPVGITGTVAVQARQTLDETRWLLHLAHIHGMIRGVVGWVPLGEPEVGSVLEELCGDPLLRGVRHVLQDEPDESYMLRPEFNAGISVLAGRRLAYDILIFEHHLPQTCLLVDRHPNQIFIVDHAAKPRIRSRCLSPWRENIARLAERPNVYCKISGLVTEADWAFWTAEDLKPYLDILLESFGPGRLMFGSDWPVLRVACSYRRWFDTVTGYLSQLSNSERSWILRDTAVQAYNLCRPEIHS